MLSSTANVEGLLDAEPDALVGADSAGMIRFVNHQRNLLFGYDSEDLIGSSVEVLVQQPAQPPGAPGGFQHPPREPGHAVGPETEGAPPPLHPVPSRGVLVRAEAVPADKYRRCAEVNRTEEGDRIPQGIRHHRARREQ